MEKPTKLDAGKPPAIFNYHQGKREVLRQFTEDPNIIHLYGMIDHIANGRGSIHSNLISMLYTLVDIHPGLVQGTSKVYIMGGSKVW